MINHLVKIYLKSFERELVKECCNLPTCESKIVGTHEGRLIKKGFWTCGKVIKQIEELKKIKIK